MRGKVATKNWKKYKPNSKVGNKEQTGAGAWTGAWTPTEADKYNNDWTRSEGKTQTKYTDTDDKTRKRWGGPTGEITRGMHGTLTDRGRQREEHWRHLKDTWGHGKSKTWKSNTRNHKTKRDTRTQWTWIYSRDSYEALYNKGYCLLCLLIFNIYSVKGGNNTNLEISIF